MEKILAMETRRTWLQDWFVRSQKCIPTSTKMYKLELLWQIICLLILDKPQNCIIASPMNSRVHMEGFDTWQTSIISLIVHAFVHNAVLVISTLGV